MCCISKASWARLFTNSETYSLSIGSVSCGSLQGIIELFYLGKSFLAPPSERWLWFPPCKLAASHLKLPEDQSCPPFQQHLSIQVLRRRWALRTSIGNLRTVFPEYAQAWQGLCPGLCCSGTIQGSQGLGLGDDGQRKVSDLHSKIRQARRALSNSPSNATKRCLSLSHSGLRPSLIIYNLELWHWS